MPPQVDFHLHDDPSHIHGTHLGSENLAQKPPGHTLRCVMKEPFFR